MSSVRMCDRCGDIFPEGAEGSAVGTVTVMKRDSETGRKMAIQETQDQCPPCAGGGTVPTPRIRQITADTVEDSKR